MCTLVLKYPSARHYVAAHSRVSSDDQPSGERGTPHAVYLRDLVQRAAPRSCGPDESIRDVARRLWTTGADAIAIVDSLQRAHGALTRTRVLEWLAEDSGSVDQPVACLLRDAMPAVPSRATCPGRE